MSIRLEKATSRGRFSRGSLTLGTKIALISLGVRDKLIEDVLGSSINAHSYLMAERLTKKMEAPPQEDGASRDGTTILYCTPSSQI